MNRQKILVITIGSIAALFFGHTMVGLYRDTLKERSAKIVSLNNTLKQINDEKQKSNKEAEEWTAIGAQTLSMDPDEDMKILRDGLFELIKKTGLEKEKVDLGTVQNWGRNGVRSLGCSITAEGNMDRIIDFLFTVYRRPFVIRIKALTLTPAGSGKNAIKGRLKMNVKLETLILPPNGKVPTVTPVDLKDKAHLKEVDRTQFAKLDDYKSILDRKIWEAYVPPMPGKASGPMPARDAQKIDPASVKLTWVAGAETQKHQVFWGEGTPTPTQNIGTLTRTDKTEMTRTGLKPATRYVWRVDEVGDTGLITPGDVWVFTTGGTPPPGPIAENTHPQPPLPPPLQPPPDSKMVLKRVLSSPVRQQAILVEPGQVAVPNAPEKRIEVGEPLFGGILVYVHPRGVVSERDNLLRFHPLNAPLEQGQPITEQTEPEIYYELKKLEASAGGISERPG